MKASKYGHAASGHGKFWVAMGVQPELYRYGPYDDRDEAESEARQMCEDDGLDAATVGEGEEVELNVPDADDIIERISEGMYEQCGEAGEDYLSPRSVPTEAKAELTAAVEKAVADWLTKHNLWPTFCKVEPVGEVTLPAEQEVKNGE